MVVCQSAYDKALQVDPKSSTNLAISSCYRILSIPRYRRFNLGNKGKIGLTRAIEFVSQMILSSTISYLYSTTQECCLNKLKTKLC